MSGNFAPPSVLLQLDRERKWQFDMNAIIALYDALGDDALQQLTELPRDAEGKVVMSVVAFKMFRALLWCGLLSDDPKLTLNEAGALTSPKTVVEVLLPALEKVNEALDPQKAQSVPA